MSKKHNYTEKDLKYMKKHGIKSIIFYDEKIAIARKHDYESYIEFVIETDKTSTSTRHTGAIVGMEQYSTIIMLRRLEIPPRPRGGHNNPWGRKGNPQCKKLS